jgi:DMSO/TMAO reductase YedYZ heme-binding membrane subunit
MDVLQILWIVAVYLGLAALLLFIFTVLTGSRIIKTKPKRHIHKKLALTAFTLVCVHGLVMIYFYFFS